MRGRRVGFLYQLNVLDSQRIYFIPSMNKRAELDGIAFASFLPIPTQLKRACDSSQTTMKTELKYRMQ
jgi:hypothetical protein